MQSRRGPLDSERSLLQQLAVIRIFIREVAEVEQIGWSICDCGYDEPNMTFVTIIKKESPTAGCVACFWPQPRYVSNDHGAKPIAKL
mmetsp:Transcript_5478/g.10862  ORF Transcript_5478/g.10862 Transcript_5478/m.10862 type:complete len:87 (+) Transcript_5478:210-470(+)